MNFSDIAVTVVMPIVAPIMKVENCKKYGANVIVHGKDIGESRERALEIGKAKGLMYINGFDHPNILAGQAQWTIWLKFRFFRTF